MKKPPRMSSGMCMVLAAALALLCQAELELPQRRRGLKQNPQASSQWFDIHSTYVAATQQAVGKVRYLLSPLPCRSALSYMANF